MSDLSLAENNPLLGTWKLMSVSAILDDGTAEEQVYGSSPIGYITYTPEGRILVIFSRSDRSLLSGEIHSPLSSELDLVLIEERAQAFSTFSAYAGTYSVSDNIVTHHVEIASIPNRVGTDLIRTFRLFENQVTLKTLPTMSNGVSKVFELVWQRIES
ncbi:lipocalin-like domain-containing protein [Nostoc sp. NMS8]|uniref:lipocalin-like domain-containing protein n=1 Tax=Nostoc sp. NMS8 TaxID=2815392 RepID=UPI0025F3FEF0|nr:lipocalin-like domain-containing protein [Nostoc sp. NMS8]MBN3959475.1 lipocalin-like domain-containing protein [Nostoc sp. NMS8]